MQDYQDYDAIGLAALVRQRAVSPAELLDAALDRAAAVNPHLNALVHLKPDVARGLIAKGLPDGPLAGVPFLLKDLGAEAIDFPSHNGSRLYQNTNYSYDSTIYARLKASGLVTFGRTTSPEGGIGVATESAVYGGPTRNPWNTDHTPGGSSGGAGAAVAAGVVPAAHGSDGGGSVRIPASCCGLFGFKATRARLPDGPVAGEGWAGMAIDGFLTRSVRDTALLHDLCEGMEPGAPYAAPPLESSYMDALTAAPKRLRIALCDTSLSGDPLDAEVVAATHETAKLLESMGHIITPARPKADTGAMMQAWTRIVACGTALSINATVAARGVPLGDDEIENVSRSAMAYAKTVSGEDYLAAIGVIHRYGRQMAAFFDDYDVLLTPTLAEPPAKIGRFDHSRADYVDFRLGDTGVFPYSPFTAAFNASGQPAASLPLAMSKSGMPIGMHLAMGFGKDIPLMSLCAQIEAAAPWFDRRPPAIS